MFLQDRRRSISLRVKLLKAMKRRKMKTFLKNMSKYQRRLMQNLQLLKRLLSREMLILAVRKRTPKMRP